MATITMEVSRTSPTTIAWKVEATGDNTWLQVEASISGNGIGGGVRVFQKNIQAKSLSGSGSVQVRQGWPPNPLIEFSAQVGDYPQPGWGAVKARVKGQLPSTEASSRLTNSG